MTSFRACLQPSLAALFALIPVGSLAAQWSSTASVNNVFASNISSNPKAQAWVPRTANTGGQYAYVAGGLTVQTIDGAGNPSGAPVILDAVAGSDCQVAGARAGTTGSIFAYLKGNAVYAVVVDLAGTIQMGPTLVSTTSGMCFEGPAISTDKSRGAMLAWTEFEWNAQFEAIQTVRSARIRFHSGNWSLYAPANSVLQTSMTDDLFAVCMAELPPPSGAVVAWQNRASTGHVRADTARVDWEGVVSGLQTVCTPPTVFAMDLKVDATHGAMPTTR